MSRGYSLEKDLRLSINNPKYNLQDFIVKNFKNTLGKNNNGNYSQELLSTEIIQHNSEFIDSDLNNIRGIPIYRFKESELFWDRLACGSSVMAEMILENKGIFEWDIIIKKSCTIAAVGSNSVNSGAWLRGYCTSFGDRKKSLISTTTLPTILFFNTINPDIRNRPSKHALSLA
ncbi:hypothetical protein C1646_771036 [Rhizophagus diaphanus]|nr:hypothetical protein C1646_771036 [Rhizophagus diaphanus] [Rhizophagus sp. MUCL 43196]